MSETSTQINFIIGAGRSGTTLLTNLLNQWDDVTAPPENDFFLPLYYNFASKKHFSDHDIDRLIDNLWLRKKEFKEVWNLDEAKIKKELKSLDRKALTFSNIYKFIINSNEKNFSKYLFDKNPYYTYTINLLLKSFPQAKFIALIRNPLDRYESVKRVNLAKNKYPLGSAMKWYIYNKKILNFKKKWPDKILVIKYEELVTNPEITLKQIADFFNIESTIITSPENRMYIEKEENFNKRFNEMHHRSNTPITTSRISRWKDYLEQFEIEYITYVSTKIAKEFKYDLPPSALDFKKRFKFFIKSHFSKIKVLLSLRLKLLTYQLPLNLQKKLTEKVREKLKSKNLNK